MNKHLALNMRHVTVALEEIFMPINSMAGLFSYGYLIIFLFFIEEN